MFVDILSTWKKTLTVSNVWIISGTSPALTISCNQKEEKTNQQQQCLGKHDKSVESRSIGKKEWLQHSKFHQNGYFGFWKPEKENQIWWTVLHFHHCYPVALPPKILTLFSSHSRVSVSNAFLYLEALSNVKWKFGNQTFDNQLGHNWLLSWVMTTVSGHKA